LSGNKWYLIENDTYAQENNQTSRGFALIGFMENKFFNWFVFSKDFVNCLG